MSQNIEQGRKSFGIINLSSGQYLGEISIQVLLCTKGWMIKSAFNGYQPVGFQSGPAGTKPGQARQLVLP